MFHKSGIMGVATPGDGAVVALTCMCEGITPLEFAKTYHIINGRPSMRADMMHAKFRASGGFVTWINMGDDGKAAEATFEYDGQSAVIKYTIEDAKNVVGDKLDKADSNWKKDRGAMLRARLITKAIRILAPRTDRRRLHSRRTGRFSGGQHSCTRKGSGEPQKRTRSRIIHLHHNCNCGIHRNHKRSCAACRRCDH